MFYGALENQQRSLSHLQILILKCFKDIFVSMCLSVWCVNMHVGTLEGQNRVLGPLELEIQVAVNH